MILQQTDSYIKACMKTWLLCESCIHAETMSDSPRESLINKCRNCANSCFTVVCRIINYSDAVQESAFNCLLNCRECYQECEANADSEDIVHCATVCRNCAELLKSLMIPFNQN